MTKFREAEAILDYESVVDHWEDDEKSTVMDIVEEFSPDDFEMLREKLPMKSKLWNQRCAQVLMGSLTVESGQILCDLLDTDSLWQVVNVIQSLSYFDDDVVRNLTLNEAFYEKALSILEHSDLGGKVQEMLIENLNKIRHTVSRP